MVSNQELEVPPGTCARFLAINLLLCDKFGIKEKRTYKMLCGVFFCLFLFLSLPHPVLHCHQNVASSVQVHTLLSLGSCRTVVLAHKFKGLNASESFREAEHLQYET